MSRIDDAFNIMSRGNFLPLHRQSNVLWDEPIPIGHGQTNSQPATVRMMLKCLDPKPDQKVLDVGSGSGWTSALLSYLVGPEGLVYAVERVPELVRLGEDNCRRLGLKNIQFYQAGETLGLPDEAPFDRILVSASALELPYELAEQLKIGGRMVIPIKTSIFVITRHNEDHFEGDEHPGYVFVPLIYQKTTPGPSV
jgi:protein-L-isoaspartate(D-aspartate) O-methyltransferase